MRKRLFIGLIILGLLPTAGLLVWGVYKAVQSPEIHMTGFYPKSL